MYIYFVYIEKIFGRVSRKVIEWARRKDLKEVMIRAVMSLRDGAQTSARVRSVLSEEIEVKVGVHVFKHLRSLRQ